MADWYCLPQTAWLGWLVFVPSKHTWEKASAALPGLPHPSSSIQDIGELWVQGLKHFLKRTRKPIPEFRSPEEAFIIINYFMGRFAWGMLPDFKVDGPHLNLKRMGDAWYLWDVQIPQYSYMSTMRIDKPWFLLYLGPKLLLGSWLIDLSGLQTWFWARISGRSHNLSCG